MTTSTGSATIAKYDLDGNFLDLVADYNQMSPGDSPQSVFDFDSSRLLVAVENAAGRRIDLVSKNGSGISTYLTNSTALTAILRRLLYLSDGSILISRNTAVEKFSPSKARVTIGANPYVNAPAAPCATSTTLISSILTLPNGKILYTHAAATPNNKIGMISESGYAAAGDCLTSQAAPTTTALPTDMILHSSGKLLVSYGSTTAASNSIYSYDVDQSSNTITNPILSYSNISILNGPSAMVEDPANGDVLVANGINTFNTIERFSFDPSLGTLTKIGTMPFIQSNVYTRCVSALRIAP